ncbi:MAG TPA: VOC family protein [Pseudonocardiaceae bacterium]
MSEMTKYPRGVPCWIDLATDNLPAALDFYRAVFGWDFDEAETGRDPYTTVRLRGKPVAGIFVPGRDGIPVVWTTYLASDDADVTAKAITEHGGGLLTGVMDVPDEGRLLVATDPTGAVFGVWQGLAGAGGAELVNEPGTLIWNELLTADPATAREFYAAVFGIGIGEPFENEADYTSINVDGRDVGGLGVGDVGVPPHWGVYFGVADTDATVAAIRAAGGRIEREPFDSPYGRQARCADPQGARFSLLSV